MNIGVLFFSREAIQKLILHGNIVGFLFYDRNTGLMIPIDIHDDEIVILEGAYNNLSTDTKNSLLKHNLHKCPEKLWSHFFFHWQFMCDYSVFSEDPLMELCGFIMGDEIKQDEFLSKGFNLFDPISYKELCDFTKCLHSYFDIELINPVYYESFNYVVDSLLNHYRINMSRDDILKYRIQMCKIVLEKLENKHV